MVLFIYFGGGSCFVSLRKGDEGFFCGRGLSFVIYGED